MMEDMSFTMLLFLAAAGFTASFIDSVVGGGGLISLPALMMTGLPPAVALGTNKVAAFMGSLTSVLSFIRSGKIDLKLVRRLFPLSVFGSVLGVCAVRFIPPDFLKPLVVAMLVLVALYSLKRKNWGAGSTYGGLTKKMTWLSGLAALLFGFYDGFFGPGTGSFLLFAFLYIGFDFIMAAGNARALNFGSNIAAAVVFSCMGLVNYAYALPMGIAMILGAIAGTRMAIHKGAAYVRPLFLFMTAILIGKQIWDMMKS